MNMEETIRKLYELLSMEVEIDSPVLGKKVMITPEFRVAFQGNKQGGKHFIIHASGHNSDTLDIVVKPDRIELLENM